MMASFRDLNIEVDHKDYRPSALRILAVIKPDWKEDDIQIKKLQKGFANTLLKCYVGDDADDSVVLRVFGEQVPYPERLTYKMRKLHEAGIIPQVYCGFRNGVAYQYAVGEVLSRVQFKDEKIRRLVAEKLHAVHQLDRNILLGDDTDDLAVMVEDKSRKMTEEDYSDVTSLPRFKDNLPTPAELYEEVKACTKLWNDLYKRSPKVFGHMDAHENNIIYDSEKESLTFIDWDVSNVCPEVYDLVPLLDRDSTFQGVFTDSESRKQWIFSYLSSHPVYGREPITQQMLDKWYRDSIQASVWSTLFIIVFCYGSIKSSTLDVDFLGMTIMQYNKYTSFKKELQELDAAAQ